MKLQDFMSQLFERAKAAGFTECELYCSESESLTVRVFEGAIDEYKLANPMGLSFRGLIDGKMGYASTECMDENAIAYLIQNAKDNAAVLETVEKTEIFAGSAEYAKLNLMNTDLAKMTPAEKIELLKSLEKAVFAADSRVKHVAYCSLGTTYTRTLIANTKGLHLADEMNYAYIMACPVVEENGEVKNNFADFAGKSFKNFNVEAFAKKITAEAAAQLGATSAKTGAYPVILENGAMSDLLSAFGSVFYADKVLKGFSLLGGKLGEKIASEVVTLRDDALLEDGLRSTTFDSEGVATANKLIVQNGVLRTFLHNLKTANAMGTESTGNGFKASITAPVDVSATNAYIVASDMPVGALLSQMGNGLYITGVTGLHAGVSPTSGDFSLLSHGFMVENGKITRPVEQITLAGNFFELLKNIIAVANDLRLGTEVFNSPSVYVKSLDVSGN